MINLKPIEQGAPLREHIEECKAFANIVDTTQEAVLMRCLKTAFRKVQEVADESLVPGEYELTVTDLEGETHINLYQTPHEVLSVQTPEGVDVPYHFIGRMVGLKETVDAIVIRYTTRPNPVRNEALMQTAYEYATALYDGESDKANEILARC